MYCTDCGTISPEGVDVCLKCGKKFPSAEEVDSDFRITEMVMEGDEKAAPAPYADIGRKAAKPAPYWQNNSSYTFRFLVLGLVVTAVVLVPAGYYMSKQSSAPAPEGAPGQMSPLDALKAAKDLRSGAPGDGTVPKGEERAEAPPGGGEGSPAPQGGEAPPVRMPVPSDGFDMSREVNAKKLQMAVSVYFAENDKYPDSLDQLPDGAVDFELDPNIYHYEVVENPYGYRIEVTLNGKYADDGENIINEDGVSKLVLKWNATQ